MTKTSVIVPWNSGLHARPAAKLVQLARRYRSTISLKAHGKVADAKSIISVILLCATFGTLLEVEATGEDEHLAASEIERLFFAEDEDPEGPAQRSVLQDPEERKWPFPQE